MKNILLVQGFVVGDVQHLKLCYIVSLSLVEAILTSSKSLECIFHSVHFRQKFE